ncbi:MAG: hypothetical protein EZS28_024628, partial [Streblomastix strix]
CIPFGDKRTRCEEFTVQCEVATPEYGKFDQTQAPAFYLANGSAQFEQIQVDDSSNGIQFVGPQSCIFYLGAGAQQFTLYNSSISDVIRVDGNGSVIMSDQQTISVIGIYNCSFRNCSAVNGGAIFIQISSQKITFTLESVVFFKCQSNNAGGAIYMDLRANVTASNIVFNKTFFLSCNAALEQVVGKDLHVNIGPQTIVLIRAMFRDSFTNQITNAIVQKIPSSNPAVDALCLVSYSLSQCPTVVNVSISDGSENNNGIQNPLASIEIGLNLTLYYSGEQVKTGTIIVNTGSYNEKPFIIQNMNITMLGQGTRSTYLSANENPSRPTPMIDLISTFFELRGFTFMYHQTESNVLLARAGKGTVLLLTELTINGNSTAPTVAQQMMYQQNIMKKDDINKMNLNQQYINYEEYEQYEQELQQQEEEEYINLQQEDRIRSTYLREKQLLQYEQRQRTGVDLSVSDSFIVSEGLLQMTTVRIINMRITKGNLVSLSQFDNTGLIMGLHSRIAGTLFSSIQCSNGEMIVVKQAPPDPNEPQQTAPTFEVIMSIFRSCESLNPDRGHVFYLEMTTAKVVINVTSFTYCVSRSGGALYISLDSYAVFDFLINDCEFDTCIASGTPEYEYDPQINQTLNPSEPHVPQQHYDASGIERTRTLYSSQGGALFFTSKKVDSGQDYLHSVKMNLNRFTKCGASIGQSIYAFNMSFEFTQLDVTGDNGKGSQLFFNSCDVSIVNGLIKAQDMPSPDPPDLRDDVQIQPYHQQQQDEGIELVIQSDDVFDQKQNGSQSSFHNQQISNPKSLSQLISTSQQSGIKTHRSSNAEIPRGPPAFQTYGMIYMNDSNIVIQNSSLINSDVGCIKMDGGSLYLEYVMFKDNRFKADLFPTLHMNVNCTNGGTIASYNCTYADNAVGTDLTLPVWITDHACNLTITPEDFYGPPFILIPRITSSIPVPTLKKGFLPYVEMRGVNFYPFNTSCHFVSSIDADYVWDGWADVINEHKVNCPLPQEFISKTNGNMRVSVANDGYNFSNSQTTFYLYTFDSGVILEDYIFVVILGLSVFFGFLVVVSIVIYMILQIRQCMVDAKDKLSEIRSARQAEEIKKRKLLKKKQMMQDGGVDALNAGVDIDIDDDDEYEEDNWYENGEFDEDVDEEEEQGIQNAINGGP